MTAPQIDVWHGNRQSFGGFGSPSPLIHVLGRVDSARPLHVVSYSHNGGRRFPIPIGPDGFRLLRAGDFNIEIDEGNLRSGENELRLFASDVDGNESTTTVEISVEPGSEASLPIEIDFADGETNRQSHQIVDGRWTQTDDGLRIAEPGYDRIISFGDLSWASYEATAEFTFHGLDDSASAWMWPSMHPELGLRVCWQGHYDWGDIRPIRGWFPMAADGGFVFVNRQDVTAELKIRHDPRVKPMTVAAPITLQVGTRYRIRLAVTSIEGQLNRYRLKCWSCDSPEPTSWMVEAEGNERELRSGSVLFNAHHVDVTVHRVEAHATETGPKV